MDIVFTSYAYHFTETLHNDHPEAMSMMSKGHAYDFKSNILQRLPQIFFDIVPDDGYDYLKIYGLDETQHRVYKYIRAEYVKETCNLHKWKVFVPRGNGTGALGEALSTPVIGEPTVGHTETFLSIGSFNTRNEAEACLKYIKTKFTRAMLGILKVTQLNPNGTWKYVPLQDFTSASDIDWSKTIPEIDRQLYAKYGLDEAEIAFIESHVKEMN